MDEIINRQETKSPWRFLEINFFKWIYQPFVQWYTNTERMYAYKDIIVKVKPGVAHPGFFYSTNFLLEFLEFINFRRKKILEIGSGSGLISIVAAKDGANVTAIDICPLAVKNTDANIILNRQKILEGNGNAKTILSDLFENVPAGIYDILLIDQSTFRKNSLKNENWSSMLNQKLEYFQTLFSKCRNFMDKESEMYIVLPGKFDFKTLQSMSKENGIKMQIVSVRSFITESLIIWKATLT